MEKTRCLICGLDLLPHSGVFWYRPGKRFADKDPHGSDIRHHIGNGMHADCYDAHRSVLGLTKVVHIDPLTLDHVYDMAAHQRRIYKVKKQSTESWDAYMMRREHPGPGHETGVETMNHAIANMKLRDGG